MKFYDLNPIQERKVRALRKYWFELSNVRDLERKLERAKDRLYKEEKNLDDNNITISEAQRNFDNQDSYLKTIVERFKF